MRESMHKNKNTIFDDNNENKMYILSVIVENKPGVLFRITNLFRSRNFNIESITVGITEKPDLSRMTITTVSDVKTLEQLVKQLQKLIDVIQINVLNKENAVYRVGTDQDERQRSHSQDRNCKFCFHIQR